MTLEDFEKSLAEASNHKQFKARHKDGTQERRHHHRHRRNREDRDEHQHKRRRRDQHQNEDLEKHTAPEAAPEKRMSPPSSGKATSTDGAVSSHQKLTRDSWMEKPSSLDFDFTQRGTRSDEKSSRPDSSKAGFDLKIHENELNKHHLQNLKEGTNIEGFASREPPENRVDYTIGDVGASWRMTKLRGVYNRANEARRPVDDVAVEQYGSLESFDEAREEQIELERRETYGEGYVGKERPSGELYAERRIEVGIKRHSLGADHTKATGEPQSDSVDNGAALETTVSMDQSTLNRLKAQMIKSKMKGGPEAARLEKEYETAMARFSNQPQPDVVVLGAMDNRMLGSSRKEEVRAVDTKRGRERGLVENNDDMTIEDMVREERRTKGRSGGDGRSFAETIAKDGKFDNNLEYLDENALKLSKRVQRSDINLRNMAISDFKKLNKVLDSCPLCHHEESNKPPLAPVVSLATRVYLTLPTEPEISDGGACIVPIQHRDNLLFCDDDEWEEIRNFMKSLTRMYHDQGRDVIFYENAAAPQRKKHATLEAVPLPYSMGNTAPAFFREAILASDDEWTQHKKLIDTLAKARDGLGKSAFRRTLAKEIPYFHVWFEIDGGLGHVVEDLNRWPKGDLFAREVVGGMLDIGPDIIRKQGRWSARSDTRVEGFRRRWRKFDWTRVLHDG